MFVSLLDNGKESDNFGVIIGGAIGGVLLLVLIIIIVICLVKSEGIFKFYIF